MLWRIITRNVLQLKLLDKESSKVAPICSFGSQMLPQTSKSSKTCKTLKVSAYIIRFNFRLQLIKIIKRYIKQHKIMVPKVCERQCQDALNIEPKRDPDVFKQHVKQYLGNNNNHFRRGRKMQKCCTHHRLQCFRFVPEQF